MSSKLIGIDFGLAKIGLSISDPSKIISIPLKVVRYETKNQADKIGRSLKSKFGLDFRIINSPK